MDLDYNAQQKLLQKAAEDFLKKECPKQLVRNWRDAESDYPEELWKKMAGLGWMGAAVPEAYGGSGGDFMDLAILMQAMGEACLPAPFFSTSIVAVTALKSSGNLALKKELLPKIAAGDLVVCFALVEPGNTYGWSNLGATAVKADEGYMLCGTKLFVSFARSSDMILVVAEVPGQGPGLFAVQTDLPGIVMNPVRTLDYARQCEVRFDQVRMPDSHVLALGLDAEKMLHDIEESASVARCAEMLGCMQAVLNMTVSYAKTRKQFGRPIGSFQAIAHHCANMAIDVDCSRCITHQAAWKISRGLPVTREAAMAKYYTGMAANRVVKLGHQVHGAVSFCDEHDMHLFLRRCKAASIDFGDAEYHLEKTAQTIGI